MIRYYLIFTFLAFTFGIIKSQAQVKGQKDSGLNKIKNFAENYEPKPEKGNVVPKIPVLSESMRNNLFKAYNEDSVLVNKYLTLVLLKLYRYHLKCCNQSYGYETSGGVDKKKQAILYLYFRYNKLSDQDIFEVGSYLPYDLVQKNNILLSYKLIDKEVNQIKLLKK